MAPTSTISRPEAAGPVCSLPSLKHGVRILQTGQRQSDGHAHALLENVGDKALDDPENIVDFHEGHFHVELGEFGLAVGAQVLVAEAARDLEILVEAETTRENFCL